MVFLGFIQTKFIEVCPTGFLSSQLPYSPLPLGYAGVSVSALC